MQGERGEGESEGWLGLGWLSSGWIQQIKQDADTLSTGLLSARLKDPKLRVIRADDAPDDAPDDELDEAENAAQVDGGGVASQAMDVADNVDGDGEGNASMDITSQTVGLTSPRRRKPGSKRALKSVVFSTSTVDATTSVAASTAPADFNFTVLVGNDGEHVVKSPKMLYGYRSYLRYEENPLAVLHACRWSRSEEEVRREASIEDGVGQEASGRQRGDFQEDARESLSSTATPPRECLALSMFVSASGTLNAAVNFHLEEIGRETLVVVVPWWQKERVMNECEVGAPNQVKDGTLITPLSSTLLSGTSTATKRRAQELQEGTAAARTPTQVVATNALIAQPLAATRTCPFYDPAFLYLSPAPHFHEPVEDLCWLGWDWPSIDERPTRSDSTHPLWRQLLAIAVGDQVQLWRVQYAPDEQAPAQPATAGLVASAFMVTHLIPFPGHTVTSLHLTSFEAPSSPHTPTDPLTGATNAPGSSSSQSPLRRPCLLIAASNGLISAWDFLAPRSASSNDTVPTSSAALSGENENSSTASPSGALSPAVVVHAYAAQLAGRAQATDAANRAQRVMQWPVEVKCLWRLRLPNLSISDMVSLPIPTPRVVPPSDGHGLPSTRDREASHAKFPLLLLSATSFVYVLDVNANIPPYASQGDLTSLHEIKEDGEAALFAWKAHASDLTSLCLLPPTLLPLDTWKTPGIRFGCITASFDGACRVWMMKKDFLEESAAQPEGGVPARSHKAISSNHAPREASKESQPWTCELKWATDVASLLEELRAAALLEQLPMGDAQMPPPTAIPTNPSPATATTSAQSTYQLPVKDAASMDAFGGMVLSPNGLYLRAVMGSIYRPTPSPCCALTLFRLPVVSVAGALRQLILAGGRISDGLSSNTLVECKSTTSPTWVPCYWDVQSATRGLAESGMAQLISHLLNLTSTTTNTPMNLAASLMKMQGDDQAHTSSRTSSKTRTAPSSTTFSSLPPSAGDWPRRVALTCLAILTHWIERNRSAPEGREDASAPSSSPMSTWRLRLASLRSLCLLLHIHRSLFALYQAHHQHKRAAAPIASPAAPSSTKPSTKSAKKTSAASRAKTASAAATKANPPVASSPLDGAPQESTQADLSPPPMTEESLQQTIEPLRLSIAELHTLAHFACLLSSHNDDDDEDDPASAYWAPLKATLPSANASRGLASAILSLLNQCLHASQHPPLSNLVELKQVKGTLPHSLDTLLGRPATPSMDLDEDEAMLLGADGQGSSPSSSALQCPCCLAPSPVSCPRSSSLSFLDACQSDEQAYQEVGVESSDTAEDKPAKGLIACPNDGLQLSFCASTGLFISSPSEMALHCPTCHILVRRPGPGALSSPTWALHTPPHSSLILCPLCASTLLPLEK